MYSSTLVAEPYKLKAKGNKEGTKTERKIQVGAASERNMYDTDNWGMHSMSKEQNQGKLGVLLVNFHEIIRY